MDCSQLSMLGFVVQSNAKTVNAAREQPPRLPQRPQPLPPRPQQPLPLRRQQPQWRQVATVSHAQPILSRSAARMVVVVEHVTLGTAAKNRAPAKISPVVWGTSSTRVTIIDVARANAVGATAVTEKRLAQISLVAMAKSRPMWLAVEHSVVRLAIAAQTKLIVTSTSVGTVCVQNGMRDFVAHSHVKIVNAVRQCTQHQQPRPRRRPQPQQPRQPHPLQQSIQKVIVTVLIAMRFVKASHCSFHPIKSCPILYLGQGILVAVL